MPRAGAAIGNGTDVGQVLTGDTLTSLGPLWLAYPGRRQPRLPDPSYASPALVGRVFLWTDTLLGGGPGHGGVELNSTVLRVLVPGFHLDIPRTSVRSPTRSARRIRRTIGVHSSRGRWLVNGSYSGLVELTIQPPCYTPGNPARYFAR